MEAGVDGEFGVEDAGAQAELLEEKFETVAAVDVVDEDDAFAFDELELEDYVCKEEFLFFGASRVLLEGVFGREWWWGGRT